MCAHLSGKGWKEPDMSVAEHFGLDDPESPLLAEARAAWVHWRIQDPDLAVVDDLLDLRDWTRRAQSAAKDPMLAKLAALARDDVSARSALVWLLIPGATKVAARLGDLSPEIDGLVAGQLWIEVSRSHHLGPHGIAQAILNETRRQVTAELGVGSQAKLRDKVWAEVRLLDHFEDRAAPVEPMEPDTEYELLELFDAALCDHAIDGFDIWLLHDLATEATALAAPMRRGRCGLTSPSVVARVASVRPEAVRTLRRRVGAALDRLTDYAAARSDEDRLAQWRVAHPQPIATQRELAQEEADFVSSLEKVRGLGAA